MAPASAATEARPAGMRRPSAAGAVSPVEAAVAAPAPRSQVDDEALREAVWARVQMARNVLRPHTLELLASMATDVVELHGDRGFGDDLALVGGFARIGEH